MDRVPEPLDDEPDATKASTVSYKFILTSWQQAGDDKKGGGEQVVGV